MLVSVSELVTYMDISFSLRQQDAAEIVLEGLQSELEAYLNRPIELQEFTETYVVPGVNDPMPMTSFFYNTSTESSFYTYPGNTANSIVNYSMPPETIYLRNSPVVEVEEVKLTPFNGVERTLETTEYIVRRFGIDIANLIGNDTVEVTYTAGLDGTQIPMFRSLILRAATREMQNMHDDVVGVKDLNTRNVAPLETGFSERELMSVRKYRRRKVVG